jgi:hypothetical protein
MINQNEAFFDSIGHLCRLMRPAATSAITLNAAIRLHCNK